MKIAFLGDSITEGVPGVSYVDLVQKALPDYEIGNYGKGGDTVLSLKNRIKKLDLTTYDIIVLFIGVNDSYSRLTTTYKVLKTIMNQRWSTNFDTFKSRYKDLLDILPDKKVFIIPPLVMGEVILNRWNDELNTYNEIIKNITKNRDNATLLDTRNDFLAYLSDKKQSDYLPYKLTELMNDVKNLDTADKVDNKSNERGLHLTLDGIHINSTGAKMIKDSIVNHIKEMA